MTKEELKQLFSDGQLASGSSFSSLIDSLKALQTAVSSPASSGSAVVFVESVTQDAEGKITVVRKTVNFSGYQTVAGMADYQDNDLQRTGVVAVDGGGTDIETVVEHNMKHYPTVRLINESGEELRPTQEVPEPYAVNHTSTNSLTIILRGAVNTGATYSYVLD